MLEIQNVTHAYGQRVILKDLNLQLKEKRIAIIGSNGCGKSTFVRLLNGLLVPKSGDVLVDGLNTRTDGKAIRRKVGFVFQNPDNQIVFPVVEEDLAFGMKNLGFTKDTIQQRIQETLSRYDLLQFRGHPAHLLSGGQKQLLAISGVLVMDPAYIIFDEPTTLLDLRNKRRVAEAIDNLSQTVIVVSHDLEFLAGFDRVLVFDDGQVVVDDIPTIAIPEYIRMMS
ncbi:energy-coupling factor ABC transporter ATP-binding protein [Photorhabdus heterorhabditis]|uniref:ATP-binding cassette domain-containing protein n=1 Tax=Photorhabdus heterorhabditis TaxID=880156 RepID=A0A5B0X824_9GAMM|nr:ATP-binding cassette domain-containing protein [Photorhabdus heterorhabditis]KAA1195443.1 ATP-binding cassette domain-containing protein [Photorhabdus heterorhabditis]KOY63046.1 cobalt ABC transporter ATP-binding protein [Photorhabdus heterorhabditis]MBS9441097.1 ATP-binding cassette domain-containing protein [Photorhabdus heterorhabditis]NRN27810.1 ATP-binding cassette domain-containing protein [Photorhabdus heterorhabditis subsp. aluminescens]